ncbi:hypothetical protein ACHAPJ_013556 [Fusarium lateritium]
MGILERWYDPAAGLIQFEQRDIENINLAWLGTQIYLIQQEPILFSGTIIENVAFGLEGTTHANAPHEEKLALVKAACQYANAHHFIERLPRQYETWIGERARMLSGGQKQRIAIARRIISRPSARLLDEASSALDSKTKKAVQDALDRISVVIAHKLSTVQKAHGITFISAGRVVQQGTPQDLIALMAPLRASPRRKTLKRQKTSPLNGRSPRVSTLGRKEDQSRLNHCRPIAESVEGIVWDIKSLRSCLSFLFKLVR